MKTEIIRPSFNDVFGLNRNT